MKQYLVLGLLAVLLFAGCTTPSTGPGANVSNSAMHMNQTTSSFQVDQAKIGHVISVIDKFLSLQGLPPQQPKIETTQLIKLTYTVQGQQVAFYVTPDYQNVVVGKPTSVAQIEQFVEQSSKPTNLSVPLAIDSAAHIRGNKSAPIVVIEFGDYQCPYCVLFAQQTYEAFLKKYVDTGKVEFAFWDFPLPFHQMAMPASIAAECAAKQGKYWEMHDALYLNQSLQDKSKQLSEQLIQNIAKNIGLNMTAFDACRNDTSVRSGISALESRAQQNYQVGGTPTFLIYSTKKLSDAQIQKLVKDFQASAVRGKVVIGSDGKAGVIVSGALPINVFDQIVADMSG